MDHLTLKEDKSSPNKFSFLSSSFSAILMPMSSNLGLVVKGGDSCSEGRRFESQSRVLYVHLPIYLL